MNIANFRVGQKVYFGRPNGEKTLGEIVKLNPSKAKVRTLESRGSRSTAGVVWGVPYSLIKPADGDAQPTSTPAMGTCFPSWGPDLGRLNAVLASLVAQYGAGTVAERLEAITKSGVA